MYSIKYINRDEEFNSEEDILRQINQVLKYMKDPQLYTFEDQYYILTNIDKLSVDLFYGFERCIGEDILMSGNSIDELLDKIKIEEDKLQKELDKELS